MSKSIKLVSGLLLVVLVLSACGGGAAPAATSAPAATQPPAATEAPAATQAPAATEAPAATQAPAAMGKVTFFSTQFSPVEEQAKFRAILNEGGFDYTTSEEGPLLDVIIASQKAGSGTVDVIGALHGTFPPLERADALMNMTDVAGDLLANRNLTEAYLKTGLLGSADYLYYIPWMQATYIMAATKDSLQYLPQGADINALTWEQLGDWCKAIYDQTGTARCGLPHAGLFHRFLEGYLWPSFTGGMVTTFKSADAVSMLEWARDSLWPYVNPQSINYQFMQEPLLAGEVWVAFDHTARLLDAFNQKPDDFVAFPAPAGPKGRGFMPVIVGLGIPKTAPNAAGGEKLIDFLTTAKVQGEVLKELGFFPVVDGVDTTGLPAGIAIELKAVETQSNSADALPSLLPVGLGERGGEINQIYRNAFDQVVLDKQDPQTVLATEGANLQTLMNETGAPCWAPDPLGEGVCQVK